MTASPTASAQGERVSSTSWRVIVDWSIDCNVSGGSYFGTLNLVDVATGERIFLGGTSRPAGNDRVNVARRATARFLFPRIRSSCSGPPPQSHGSEFRETDGAAVRIPPLGEGDARRGAPTADRGGATSRARASAAPATPCGGEPASARPSARRAPTADGRWPGGPDLRAPRGGPDQRARR